MPARGPARSDVEASATPPLSDRPPEWQHLRGTLPSDIQVRARERPPAGPPGFPCSPSDSRVSKEIPRPRKPALEFRRPKLRRSTDRRSLENSPVRREPDRPPLARFERPNQDRGVGFRVGFRPEPGRKPRNRFLQIALDRQLSTSPAQVAQARPLDSSRRPGRVGRSS